MGAFIGPLGGLIEATQWQEQQSVSTGADPSFFTGLDGARTAFVQPPAGRALREWSVSMSKARPEQAAAFQALAMGAMGIGPFVFADPLAQVTNLLTPRMSLMDPALLSTSTPRSNITAATLDGEPAGLVPTTASAGYWGYNTPVHPQRPVTLSLTVQGSASVEFRVMRKDWTYPHLTQATVSAAQPERVSLTLAPPFDQDAVMCGFAVTATTATLISRPQITWTRQPMVWSPGRGAKDVVVHGLKESFDRASPRPHGSTWLDYSATVTEVGSGA